MYFKIKANDEILYLPIEINRDEWNTIDEQGLITIVDVIDNKNSQKRKVISQVKNKESNWHRKDRP